MGGGHFPGVVKTELHKLLGDSTISFVGYAVSKRAKGPQSRTSNKKDIIFDSSRSISPSQEGAAALHTYSDALLSIRVLVFFTEQWLYVHSRAK